MAANVDKISPQTAEFSRMVAIGRLDGDKIMEKIEASEAERVALARRFGLVSLDKLEADVTLRRMGHGPVVRFEGSLRAKVVQRCVVSLDSIENVIEEDFALHFAPERRDRPSGHVIEKDYGDDGDDLPEPLVDDQIDIGEAVAQHLALALDPYPRRPGVTLEDVLGPSKGAAAASEAQSPFAVLARHPRRKS
jgi:Large ribosomal RNA subunit accumulation protein YceD